MCVQTDRRQKFSPFRLRWVVELVALCTDCVFSCVCVFHFGFRLGLHPNNNHALRLQVCRYHRGKSWKRALQRKYIINEHYRRCCMKGEGHGNLIPRYTCSCPPRQHGSVYCACENSRQALTIPFINRQSWSLAPAPVNYWFNQKRENRRSVSGAGEAESR